MNRGLALRVYLDGLGAMTFLLRAVMIVNGKKLNEFIDSRITRYREAAGAPASGGPADGSGARLCSVALQGGTCRAGTCGTSEMKTAFYFS